jgi:hypothetical protein
MTHQSRNRLRPASDKPSATRLKAGPPRGGPAGRADSAQPEKVRGALPNAKRVTDFRDTVTERVHARMCDIDADRVELLELGIGPAA